MNLFVIGVALGVLLVVLAGNIVLRIRQKDKMIRAYRSAIYKEKRNAIGMGNLLEGRNLTQEQLLVALDVLDTPSSNYAKDQIRLWRNIADTMYEVFRGTPEAKVSVEGAAAILSYESARDN